MKKAFSLLEILIALAVMLVGIVGTASLFPVGLRASSVTSNITKATILAERVLSSIKFSGYASLPSPPDTSPWTQFTTPDDTDFWWQWVITDPGVTNLKQVEIRIGWDDRDTPYSDNYISFFTYVANN